MSKKPNERDKALDIRQSPIGFFNLGLSFLAAADALTEKADNKNDSFRLSFDSPIQHLYAHGWELCLKACIFQQGELPSQMKNKIGHNLTEAWDQIDKVKFSVLKLTPESRQIVELLDTLHSTRLFAYPITGIRQQWSVTFMHSSSKRFRISRKQIIQLFADNKHCLDQY
jgi:hypothetical protein